MPRTRGENLHSIFVLLFLTIAFFFLEFQDPQRYSALFSFDPAAVASGQLWRLISYQFAQSGAGSLFHMPAVVGLFINLFMLYYLGAPVEEAMGTRSFLAYYVVTLVGTAGVAWLLAISLSGPFFVSSALLFAFATLFPDEVLYLIVFPVRVRWLAYVALGLLAFAAIGGSRPNIAVLLGSALGYAYFLLQRGLPRFASAGAAPDDDPAMAPGGDQGVARNRIRFAAIRNALTSQNAREIDRLIAESEREVVRGVNICPPIDYKPQSADGYCLRCEGFAECSARHLRLNRESVEVPATPPVSTAVPS